MKSVSFFRNTLCALFLFTYLFSTAEAGDIAECTLKLVIRTAAIDQEPLSSLKVVKLSYPATKTTPDRINFDLTGTKWLCHARFNGSKKGTGLNCWTSEMKEGMKSDGSDIDGYSAPSTLSYSKDGVSETRVTFSCK